MSVALIREAVAHFLMPPTKGKASDPFLAIAGKHAGGPGDSAERHDTYTYRRKRK
jgi:hypothetical protein